MSEEGKVIRLQTDLVEGSGSQELKPPQGGGAMNLTGHKMNNKIRNKENVIGGAVGGVISKLGPSVGPQIW